MHSENGMSLVLVLDLESDSSEVGDSHYIDRGELYCGAEYGAHDGEEEAVLTALIM